MALKNKDGSTFRLSHPNPHMTEQILWDKEDKFIIHNKCGKKVVFDKNIRPITKHIPEPEIEPRNEDTTWALPVQDKIRVDIDEEDEKILRNKIEVWCLPAEFENRVDPLYGESFTQLKYGKKFIYEAILEEDDDFYITMWTTVDKITEGSIIFPRTFDKRWWRVSGVHKDPERNLYLVKATLTSYQPSFS